jgi:uncharacterized protein YeaO (DUF488 family)
MRVGSGMNVQLKRAYLPPAPDDGFRVLVDRLWPRGLTKADAALDLWLKDAAPSTELRRWFGHDPGRWAEFRQRYEAELAAMPGVLRQLIEAAHGTTITLVYGARDETHNHALVLRDALMTMLDPRRKT